MAQSNQDDPALFARKLSVVYAHMPTPRGVRKMHADLYLPKVERPPLLVWFHSGGFRRGSIDHPTHPVIGHEFARHNIATAVVQYRLNTPPACLSEKGQSILPHLIADAEAHDVGMRSFLTGSGAVAAMENGIVFLKWLKKIGPRHGLTGPILLGGSSAGAITVLNLLSLPMHLGERLPKIHTAFCLSGGFAYPSFYIPQSTPILALHNPTDPRVPIDSIRAYARQAGSICTLAERKRSPHGSLKFFRKETLSVAVDRLVSFAQGHSVTGDKNP